jgi:hypothetical protein
MKIAKYIILILIAISCKKDKLIGEKEILVGTWEWLKTERINSGCANNFAILSPLTENTTYQIQIEDNGEIIFFENNSVKEKKRIKFSSWNKEGSNEYYFGIYLNGDRDQNLQGKVRTDTLITFNLFPFNPIEEFHCEDNTSYFVRK